MNIIIRAKRTNIRNSAKRTHITKITDNISRAKRPNIIKRTNRSKITKRKHNIHRAKEQVE